VDDSLAIHVEWQAEEVAFESIDGEVFSKPEPEILFRPVDLVEPTVTSSPNPVPNVPEDEFTQEQLEAQRISEIKAEAKSLILNGMSEEEQRNSLAELIAVLYTAMVDPSILQNPVVVEEANARVEAWKRVGAIREVSNKKEKGEDVSWPT